GAVVDSITFDPSEPSTMYVGTEGGIFRSTNGGARWAGASKGLGGGRRRGADRGESLVSGHPVRRAVGPCRRVSIERPSRFLEARLEGPQGVDPERPERRGRSDDARG